jgi:hypothetical protein
MCEQFRKLFAPLKLNVLSLCCCPSLVRSALLCHGSALIKCKQLAKSPNNHPSRVGVRLAIKLPFDVAYGENNVAFQWFDAVVVA